MTVINQLACMLGRKDEVPNQELARELVETKNVEGIGEIAEGLWNKNKAIQSDCIKTLYEIGYLNPTLISEYVFEFIKLLKSRNNRLVWGGMMALSTVADHRGKEIYENVETVYAAIKSGTVITVDNGIKVLAKVAAHNDAFNKSLFPYLINHLKTCRPKEVPQHAESIFVAVTTENREGYKAVLKEREDNMTASQLARVKKLYKAIDKI